MPIYGICLVKVQEAHPSRASGRVFFRVLALAVALHPLALLLLRGRISGIW